MIVAGLESSRGHWPRQMTDVRQLNLDIPNAGRVSALLMRPQRARACYVLAHGAGAGMMHRSMEAIAAGLGERGIATLRYQFPYMEKGSKRPDPPALAHATVRAAVAEAARCCCRFAVDCRRQIVRRAHDVAGAGDRAIGRRSRARLPRFSPASGRKTVQRSGEASRRNRPSDAVSAGDARCARGTEPARTRGREFSVRWRRCIW